LYMPLGFLVALYLGASGRLTAYRKHLLWGLLLSISVEVCQAFIGRFSDATDVLSNSAGYLAGFLIARIILVRYKVAPATLLGLPVGQAGERLNTVGGLRFAYVAIALLTSLLPLDISVSMTEVYSKLHAVPGQMPRLIIDPFYHFRTDDPQLQYLTLKLLLILPLGVMSGVVQVLRARPSLLIPAFHCLVFTVLIEICNLFVQSNRSDTFIPVMGFLVGLFAAWLVLRFNKQAANIDYRLAVRDWRYLLVSAGLLYSLLILVIDLSPYEFELSLRALRAKLLEDTNLIPFRLHFSVRNIGAAVDIVREFLLFAPLGGLVGLWLRSWRFTPGQFPLPTVAAAAFIGGSYALCVETLQLVVVDRYVDITDVILATGGSMAGALIAPLFLRFESWERSEEGANPWHITQCQSKNSVETESTTS